MEYYLLNDEEVLKETVTGSPNERRVVEKITSIVREYSDWVEKFETPVDTWEEIECIIEAGDKSFECKSMPYTLTGIVEGKIAYARYYGDKIISDRELDDSIVFIPFPEDPDDSKYVVLKLYEQGVVAVVFYDELPGRYRRMVIIGDEDYSHTHGSPSPLPAVSIRKEDFLKIYKLQPRRVRVVSKTRIRHGAKGYTVVAGINGRGEEEIHVTAHHDHWFKGFSDDMLGVEILVHILKELRKTWDGPNLLGISYTAEESGSPYFTSWYWIWGSRYYLETRKHRNDIDRIIADINLDAIYTYPIRINGNPALRECIELFAEQYGLIYDGYNHTDFDSYSYTLNGIPALTLHTLKEMKHIYHTDLDDGNEIRDYTVSRAINIATEIVKCVSRRRPRYRYLVEYIKDKLGDKAPLEARSLIYKLETLEAVVPQEKKRIRAIVGGLSTVIYVPSIDGLFESDLLADILEIMKRLGEIEKYAGKRIRFKVVDREQFLDISPSRTNIEELVASMKYALMQRIRYYNRKLEEIITSNIIEQQLRNQ